MEGCRSIHLLLAQSGIWGLSDRCTFAWENLTARNGRWCEPGRKVSEEDKRDRNKRGDIKVDIGIKRHSESYPISSVYCIELLRHKFIPDFLRKWQKIYLTFYKSIVFAAEKMENVRENILFETDWPLLAGVEKREGARQNTGAAFLRWKTEG